MGLALTPAFPFTVFFTEVEWEMRAAVVAAEAWVVAPLINPAKAAAARRPVEEPKIFVLRFMIDFLLVSNGDLFVWLIVAIQGS
jgi:hypothetical protein